MNTSKNNKKEIKLICKKEDILMREERLQQDFLKAFPKRVEATFEGLDEEKVYRKAQIKEINQLSKDKESKFYLFGRGYKNQVLSRHEELVKAATNIKRVATSLRQEMNNLYPAESLSRQTELFVFKPEEYEGQRRKLENQKAQYTTPSDKIVKILAKTEIKLQADAIEPVITEEATQKLYSPSPIRSSMGKGKNNKIQKQLKVNDFKVYKREETLLNEKKEKPTKELSSGEVDMNIRREKYETKKILLNH